MTGCRFRSEREHFLYATCPEPGAHLVCSTVDIGIFWLNWRELEATDMLRNSAFTFALSHSLLLTLTSVSCFHFKHC
jgi:hypothetical protein